MIAYFIKAILNAALFLGVYFLLLEKEKMHRFNRWYLISSLALSFIIPFITVQKPSETVSALNPVSIAGATSDVISMPVAQLTPLAQTNTFNPFFYLLILYGFVTAFFLFRFTKNVFSLFSETRRNTKISYSKATLVLIQKETEPHSFLRYIFLNKADYGSNAIPNEILQHELAHVEQRHSLDILFIELISAVLWFHPFLFLYKKAIQLNHEFLADDAAIRLNADVRSYQLLLLQKASGRNIEMTNHFNYFITKKRLIMLSKTTSRANVICRQMAVIAFLALSLFLFGKRSLAQDTATSSKKDKSNKAAVPANQNTSRKEEVIYTTYIWGNTIGSTKEGASDELMNEYKTLVNKYLETDTNGRKNINWEIEPADRKQMETIIKQMNREQQSKQDVMFVKPFPPSTKAIPTQNQFEAFKKLGIYGIWIDGKKRKNEVLNDYANTDFSHFSVNKLYGAAKKGRSYTHQVDLMTNKYYQDYYDEAIRHKNESILAVQQVFKKPNQ